MRRICLFLPAFALAFFSCKTPKPAEAPAQAAAPAVENKPAPPAELPPYRASRTRVNDLIHTKLEVSFDYGHQWLNGKATLTFKPYFYPSFYLDLDAIGFDIKKLELVSDKGNQPLNYTYNGKVITIKLDHLYKATEQYKVYVEYTAKPNEAKVQGSAAINDAKGLYFINPYGKEKNKPIQVWTQGETQSSSCWFPTIDSPNEKMTQEIYMTVDTSYVTLSNGLLLSQKNNGNGTRTDYWKQSLPASPYLTMMAVGKFSIIKSRWRNLDVNYYVEPEYAKYAKQIFGNTPEMLEFYSNKLGVSYPWEKFSQIVVRDYVSGAMENTSAVLHGEFLQRTDRELLDNTNEDVISHELFHQWFGDLVTAESWSNLPLNEGFADYGEYLWNEYKYSQDEADCGLQKGLSTYLLQSRTKNLNLIRYNYEDKEEMFDAISYQKGGQVLHMLRKYVGDEAFFTGLKKYLETYKFQAAEIHHLRLIFEDITGEDLNWFFNQWYLNHGHPELNINTSYNDTTHKETIHIEQAQDLTKAPIFKLPVDVDFYSKGKIERHRIVIDKQKQDFTFDLATKPNLVNVDAVKMLICTKNENKTSQEWTYQYNNAPLYMDRFEAIQALGSSSDSDYYATKTLLEAMNDKFWNIRLQAIKYSDKPLKVSSAQVRQRLVKLAESDEKSQVRASAIRALVKSFSGNDLNALYRSKVNDPSYLVMGAALEALGQKQPKEALDIAKSLENDKNPGVIKALTNLYIDKGAEGENAYFLDALERVKGTDLYLLVQSYGKFLLRLSDNTIMASLKPIENIGRHAGTWYIRLSAVQTLSEIAKKFEERETKLTAELKAMPGENKSAIEIGQKGTELSEVTKNKETVNRLVDSIKKLEKDANLMNIYGTKNTDH